MTKQSEARIDHLIGRLLQVLVFLMPLIFFTFTLNFWELWKVTMLRLVVGVLAGLGAVKMLRGGVFVGNWTRLKYPVIFLLVVAAASTLLSVDPLKSLLGEHRRFEGVLTLVGYAFLFMMAANYLGTRNARDGIINAWLLSCSLVSIYALLQHLGFDFRTWSNTDFETTRSFSTMGNPVKLASFLAFSIPVFLSRTFVYQEVESQGHGSAASQRASLNGKLRSVPPFPITTLRQRMVKKYFFAGGIALAILALFATGSRGGFVGLLFGVLAFIFFALRRAEPKKATVFLAVGLVVVLALAFFAASRGIFHTGGLATRLEVWRITLKMIARRPLLGYGLDSFRLVFSEFRSWNLIRLEGTSVFDRPHNDLLQVGSSLGLLGLAAYLWLIFNFFWMSLRKEVAGEDGYARWTTVGLLAGVLGYLVSIQFSFGSVATGSLLWLAMGLVLSPESGPTSSHRWSVAGRSVGAIALTALALVFIALGFLTPAADYFAGKGKSYEQLSPDTAEKSYRLSVALAPWEPLYRLRLAHAIREGRPGDSSSLAEAESVLRSMVALSPRETEAYLDLSALKVEEKNFAEAAFYAQKAVDLDPFSVDGYLDLGLARSARGKWGEAASLWTKALDIEPNNYYALLYLAQTYEARGKKKKALSLYEQILELYPDDPAAVAADKRLSAATQ